MSEDIDSVHKGVKIFFAIILLGFLTLVGWFIYEQCGYEKVDSYFDRYFVSSSGNENGTYVILQRVSDGKILNKIVFGKTKHCPDYVSPVGKTLTLYTETYTENYDTSVVYLRINDSQTLREACNCQ